MSRALLTSLAVVVAVVGAVFQLSIRPVLVTAGLGRVIVPVNNERCTGYPELQACEKVVIHQPTGLLYLACSTPTSRKHWTPAAHRRNATGMSTADYIATFDPSSHKITRLHITGFDSPRGLSVHGMDVVPSSSSSDVLFVYLVNHRTPRDGLQAKNVGADSVIEVFKTTVGGKELAHVRTVEDPVIATPNDLIGAPDGKSFYFTNDHGLVKTGIFRDNNIDAFLRRATTNVGYCHVDEGCKIAVGHLLGANGITRKSDGAFFVAAPPFGQVYVLDEQTDHSLVVTDTIYLDRPIDNLAVDHNGNVWGAGLVNALHLTGVHFENPSIASPSSAIRFSLNDGQSKFFGEKYKVETMFEDDGNVASGTTSAAYDSDRNRLFLHGLAAPQLTICEL